MDNTRRTKLTLIVDVIGLISAAFGPYLTEYKLPPLILGIITCFVLIKLLGNEYGLTGRVIGSIISVVMMAILFIGIYKSPSPEITDKVPSDVRTGTLSLNLEELIVRYDTESGTQTISPDISVSKGECESIQLSSIDYDIAINRYTIKNGKIIFSNIPVGTYNIKIKLHGYSMYSGTLSLKESELNNGAWNKELLLQTENAYRTFEIFINDDEGISLASAKCILRITDTEYEIENMISDSEGKLPYTFTLAENSNFELILDYDSEVYTQKYSVKEISNPLYVQFPIPKEEVGPITPIESHKPNDSATSVSYPNWDIEHDLGIDGKRYGDGLKITISNMFISLGSNGSKDVSSRMILPLPGNSTDTIFTSIIILDQSMYSSESSGTISLIVNNEEKFTTGEINASNIQAFPFEIDIGNADSIVLQTEAHLKGGDFTYGLVSNPDE